MILLCQRDKLICSFRIRIKSLQLGLSLFNGNLQSRLLLLILSRQHIKPLFCQLTLGVGFSGVLSRGG